MTSLNSLPMAYGTKPARYPDSLSSNISNGVQHLNVNVKDDSKVDSGYDWDADMMRGITSFTSIVGWR